MQTSLGFGLGSRLLLVPLMAVLVLLSGCGREHCNSCSTCTACASDVSSYPVSEPAAQPATVYVQPAPTVMTQDVSSTGLRGPRSQAELDAIFSSAQLRPLPPMPPPHAYVPAPQPSVVTEAPPACGCGPWDVQLSREWRHIVVHHSASPTGSAASFDRAHKERGWDGLGYHFVIGNGSGSGDGEVEVGYRWTRQQAGAHAGNFEFNQHGIGICLVGDFEHNGPPSPRQMASLRKLVSFLQTRTGIAANEIIGHGNVPGRNTDCPGRNLDMNAFRASCGSPIQQSSAQIPGAKQKNGFVSAVAKPEEKPILVKTVAVP